MQTFATEITFVMPMVININVFAVNIKKNRFLTFFVSESVGVKIYDIKFFKACWKPHTDKKFILYAAQPSQFFSTFLNQPGICRKPKGQKSVNQHIIFTALIRCNLIWKVWIRNWFRKLCYGFTPILHGKIIF